MCQGQERHHENEVPFRFLGRHQEDNEPLIIRSHKDMEKDQQLAYEVGRVYWLNPDNPVAKQYSERFIRVNIPSRSSLNSTLEELSEACDSLIEWLENAVEEGWFWEIKDDYMFRWNDHPIKVSNFPASCSTIVKSRICDLTMYALSKDVGIDGLNDQIAKADCIAQAVSVIRNLKGRIERAM